MKNGKIAEDKKGNKIIDKVINSAAKKEEIFLDEPDAKDFNAHLQEARETDLSELERTGYL
jgi:hypothetical protein